MEPFSTSLLIFTIVVVGAMAAMAVGPSLRPHHISAETRDVVKLGIGMVSAMSALILGLTVSSVMSSYNLTERDVQQYATDLVNLDGALRDYGAGPTPCAPTCSTLRYCRLPRRGPRAAA